MTMLKIIVLPKLFTMIRRHDHHGIREYALRFETLDETTDSLIRIRDFFVVQASEIVLLFRRESFLGLTILEGKGHRYRWLFARHARKSVPNRFAGGIIGMRFHEVQDQKRRRFGSR